MLKFIKLIVRYSLIATLCVVVYNYSVDKVGVFWRGSAFGNYEPNQRYLKTKFLLENKNKFRTILAGSSRPGFISVSNHLDSSYNFSYSQGVPQETLEDLKFLYENGLKLDTVILAVDNISFMVDSRIHNSQPLRFGYTNQKEKIKLLFTPSKVISDLRSAISTKTKLYFINKDGSKRVIKEPNPEAINWDIPSSGEYYSEDITSTKKAIKELKELCDINNTELIIFVNPLYKSTFLHYQREMEMFLDELGDFNVYNFCHLNELTSSKENYYETSHYRPHVGDTIMRVILTNNTSSTYLKKPTNISAGGF